MQAEIRAALAVFRDFPDLTDLEVCENLVRRGIERRLAARLVEFLPAAYCRAILEPAGARFPDTFRRCRRDGTITPEVLLESEPVWLAVLAYARAEINQGISRQDKLRLAGRSAEFQAANTLLFQGSKLQNIVLIPAVHPWLGEESDT
jgi:hypothetical protein